MISRAKRYILLLLVIIIVGGVAWTSFKLYGHNICPIRSVKVNGDLRFIKQQELKKILQPLSNQGLFSVNLAKVQCEIEQLPWVADAEVRRIWADKITIDITTCKPVAQWNAQGYLNAYGEIFAPSSTINLSTKLPQFFGKQDQTVKMLDNYQQMNNILNPLGLRVLSLAYGKDKSWQIVLDNGIKLQLGQNNVLDRLKRFTKVYKQILMSHNNIIPKNIDLRYSHGLAIKW